MSNKCPHCSTIFDPIPQRKTKCRACGKDIYVRNDPFNKYKTYYLSHDDALLLGVVRDLQISEKAFTEAKNKAPKGRSLGDILWGLIGQQKQEAARKNDWQTISSITRRQARHLYEVGREYFHVQQEDMRELTGGISSRCDSRGDFIL